MVGLERLPERLRRSASSSRERATTTATALALGAADVSLLALTNAYRTLANGGAARPARTVRAGARSQAVAACWTRAAAFIVADILADRSAPRRTFGLDNALATALLERGEDRHQQGHARQLVRRLFRALHGRRVGRQLLAARRCGTCPASPARRRSGKKGGCSSCIGRPDQGRPAPGFGVPPAGVSVRQIQYQDQLEAPRREYFLAGTEQEFIALAQPGQISPAIRYPSAGMLVALDPDIPPAHQRLRFVAQGVPNGRWMLDGKMLPQDKGKGAASAELAYDWMPWPGRHTLALLDSKNAVVDQVRFEVRGAVDKPKLPAKGKR